eukprot:COSAG01_NODE_74671_length_204_cov_46.323810_1_plen_30_part_10
MDVGEPTGVEQAGYQALLVLCAPPQLSCLR